MLYSEFVQGTGCKETSYNYDIYRALEGLYMVVDGMKKEDVYRLGRKYVDNSPTETEVAASEDAKQAVWELEQENNNSLDSICNYRKMLLNCTGKGEKNVWKDIIKQCEKDIKINQAKIKELKKLVIA